MTSTTAKPHRRSISDERVRRTAATRCVFYTRVSTKEQADEGYSIPAQREACRRLMAERGWTLVKEYSDRGESARTADRPQFQAMLQHLSEDPSVDILLVHKLDRLARNLEDHVTVRAMLRRYDVQLVSVTESLEESASGKLVEAILAAIAEFYSANLSQEIKKGMAEKARQGRWPSQAPLGYRNVRIDGTGRRGEAVIVPDQERAPLVRQAFELYATGEWPLHRLHEEMTQRGLRNRMDKPLSRSRLATLLRNRIYIGKVVWDGEEYDGVHEPLVSMELFERVAEVFRLHDLAGERQRRHSHYLRGTLLCGSCGSRLSSMVAKGHTYFFCLGAHNRRTTCRQPYVREEVLERQVEDLYRAIQLTAEVKRKVRELLAEEVAARNSSRRRMAEILRTRLARLSSEDEKLLRAYTTGALTLERFATERGRISAEVTLAKQELARRDAGLEQAAALVDMAVELTGDLYRAYRRATPSTRRRYNQALFGAVYVQAGGVDRVAQVEAIGH